jgi:hypothetical protein
MIRGSEFAPKVMLNQLPIAGAAPHAASVVKAAGRSDPSGFAPEPIVTQDRQLPPSAQARSAATVSSQLEELMFRQLLEQLMPRGSSHLFGKGAAGDAWRGMLVDGLAKGVAGHERLGLRSLVEPTVARATAASQHQKV